MSVSADYKYCKVEREDHLLVVTLNRPEVMNAVHPDANFELADVFDRFATDDDMWVAIVTGAGGKAFSAGADLKYAASGGAVSVPETGYYGLTARFDLTKPIIAAVEGVALGGGFELALCCDIIVAAETAVFALPEPLVGRAALAGGLLRLSRSIGLQRTMSLVLTGRRVSAREGAQLGFVNDVVAPGEALKAAKRCAREMLRCAPLSLRAAKEIAQASQDGTLADLYMKQSQRPIVRRLMTSADRDEGAKAFAERRAPRWTGR